MKPKPRQQGERRSVLEPIVPSSGETFVWRSDDHPLPWTIWNSHPECEVHLIRAGGGTCHVGDHVGSFGAGDLFLLALLGQSDEHAVLSSAGFGPSMDAGANRVLGDVLRHRAERLDEDVRLADVAQVARMTKTSFSRFFRKRTGNTFSRHLSELRIGKACGLLAGTDLPVTAICHEVGYANLSNFNRAFRDLRGMTPSRYRSFPRA